MLKRNLTVVFFCFFLTQPLKAETEGDCVPDVPVSAGLFTSPPTEIANAASVIPLGNLNAPGGHVQPADHMYISYPSCGSYPCYYNVYAMGPGKLVSIMQEGSGDYNVTIRHSCSVQSYFIHVYDLSTRILNYLYGFYNVTAIADIPWIDLGGMKLLFLDVEGHAPSLQLSAGEQVGRVKQLSGSNSWDVGVMDTRYHGGSFYNVTANRYPQHTDLLHYFGIVFPEIPSYMHTNQHLNAACFINYMSTNLTDGSTKTAWSNKTSPVNTCGQVGWDSPGTIQGGWFNPTLDTYDHPIFDYEAASLTVAPYNQAPTTKVKIGWGYKNNVMDPRYAHLAQLDLVGASPGSDRHFNEVTFNATGNINPNPANVGLTTSVCYDLPYWDSGAGATRYNYAYFYMSDHNTLKVSYDTTANTTAQCSGLPTPYPTPTGSWKSYTR